MDHANMFSSQIYIDRRHALRSQIGRGQIILLGNNESSVNFADNWYPFRQDSTFLYYFGVPLAGLVGVIDCDSGHDTLFGDDLTIDDIVWTGMQPKISEWAARCGVKHTGAITKLYDVIRPEAHYLPPYRGDQALILHDLLHIPTKELTERASLILLKAIIKQRNIKAPEELIEIDKAVTMTAAMHLQVMKSARANMKEHELVGVASKVAYDHDVNFSFLPILTKNGQTLHNHYHGHTMHEGDMILFDGGLESSMFYAGDMTRTFPVAAAFTDRQKEMYDIVHSAHEAAIRSLRPGIKFLDVHLMACQKLVEGLCAIGLMKGDPVEAVEAGAHTMFFQCGLGHMMGLDVHDMENLGEQYVGYSEGMKKSTAFGLKSLRLGRELEAGFVLTVEPGIYIIPELIDLFRSSNRYEAFINYDKLNDYRDFGGIRIEDNFVITSDGSRLLGNPIGTTSDAIETIRKQAWS